MAAITSAAWSAKRRIDGRFGAVFAQHISTDRNSTSRWCSYSWWNCCCADAIAKNSTLVWWTLKYRVRPFHPQTPGNDEDWWLILGCLSGWFTEEIIMRKERLWTRAQYTSINKDSCWLERLSASGLIINIYIHLILDGFTEDSRG